LSHAEQTVHNLDPTTDSDFQWRMLLVEQAKTDVVPAVWDPFMAANYRLGSVLARASVARNYTRELLFSRPTLSPELGPDNLLPYILQDLVTYEGAHVLYNHFYSGSTRRRTDEAQDMLRMLLGDRKRLIGTIGQLDLAESHSSETAYQDLLRSMHQARKIVHGRELDDEDFMQDQRIASGLLVEHKVPKSLAQVSEWFQVRESDIDEDIRKIDTVIFRPEGTNYLQLKADNRLGASVSFEHRYPEILTVRVPTHPGENPPFDLLPEQLAAIVGKVKQQPALFQG
jgi:hypothetical protein